MFYHRYVCKEKHMVLFCLEFSASTRHLRKHQSWPEGGAWLVKLNVWCQQIEEWQEPTLSLTLSPAVIFSNYQLLSKELKGETIPVCSLSIYLGVDTTQDVPFLCLDLQECLQMRTIPSGELAVVQDSVSLRRIWACPPIIPSLSRKICALRKEPWMVCADPK